VVAVSLKNSFVLTVQIDGDPSHVEPPLLDPPSSAPSDEPSSEDDSDLSGSDADLSDLIAQLSSDDSSTFDFDLNDSDI
jgi:hypothetical protein